MTKHDLKVGDWAAISSQTDGELSSLLIGSHVKINNFDGHHYTVEFSTGFKMYLDAVDLAPIPTRFPKDPFAPGEYVTCIGANIYGFPPCAVKVSSHPHIDKDWFCYDTNKEYEGGGAPKSHFRPATPEEIAAYKAKYEAANPEPICASDADLSITAPECSFGEKGQTKSRITFTVGGQEFYVGQRVWSLLDFQDIQSGQKLSVIGAYGNSLCVHKLGSVYIYRFALGNISTTPPAPHEWKRGDWARHEMFGVGFVYRVVKDAVPGGVFVSFEGQIPASFKPEVLTFISHSEPPE